jgi:hypothetical protein
MKATYTISQSTFAALGNFCGSYSVKSKKTNPIFFWKKGIVLSDGITEIKAYRSFFGKCSISIFVDRYIAHGELITPTTLLTEIYECGILKSVLRIFWEAFTSQHKDNESLLLDESIAFSKWANI